MQTSTEERDSTLVQYSEADLIRFGNFLFKTYGVMVHSSDGKNQPVYERGVTHADMCNWKDVNKPVFDGANFSHGDKVKVFLMPEGEDQFPGFNARILTVHHHVGKTKYDLEIRFAGDFSTRIYNVDETLISSAK